VSVSAVSVSVLINVLIEIVILFSNDTLFFLSFSFSVFSVNHTDNDDNNDDDDNDNDDVAAVQQFMKELFSQNQ